LVLTYPANTYTGDTVVDEGTLELSSTGSLIFTVGSNGVNSSLQGQGSAVLDGTFNFELANASANNGDSWTIVEPSLNVFYGPTFFVNGFNGASGTWTRDTNGVTYQFDQSTGVLSVSGGAPAGNYANWLTNYPSLTGTNALGSADPDGDGLANEVEFAFDGNPTVGTPALMTARLTGTNTVFNWIERTNGVTYAVEKSTALTNGWTAATGLVISNSANQTGVLLAPTYVRKEFVTGASGKEFYRVRATVAAD
jgi:autotransporter-associated beta strand protein